MISSECSTQGQVFHCKWRNQGCSSTQGRSSTADSGTKVAVLLEINRCSSFSLLSAPHLKKSEKIPGAPAWRWRMNLANWACRTSQKFTTGVKYQFISSIRVFGQIRDPEIPISDSMKLKYQSNVLLAVLLRDISQTVFFLPLPHWYLKVTSSKHYLKDPWLWCHYFNQ